MILRTIGMVLVLGVGAGCMPLDYDEGQDGDLSNDGASPTALHFFPGANRVTGQVTTSEPPDTRDFLSFTILPGLELSALRLVRYVDLPGGGPANRGYHALAEGPQIPVPGPMTGAQFLGGDHLDPAPPGTDLLPALADAIPNGTGFTVPLGPGTYGYVIQQTGRQISGYTLEFVVTHAGH